MEENQIIPDVLDSVPESVLRVTFSGDLALDLGNELTPEQVKDQPEVKWDADPSKFYTLIFVDPDAPSREDPKIREVLHWFVGNIPGNTVSKGDVIAGFLGSGPPKGTGLHRYIFVVFEQPGKLNFDEPRTEPWSRANRFNFSTRQIAEKYNLGQPIAGNFYVAQWDPYVTEVRAKKVYD